MKNLLAFILLFWSAATFGQNQPIIQRSSQTVVAEDARLWARLNFRVPVVVDTFHGLNNSYDSLGLEIYVPGKGFYGRDSVNGIHYWKLIGGGGVSADSTLQQAFDGSVRAGNNPIINLHNTLFNVDSGLDYKITLYDPTETEDDGYYLRDYGVSGGNANPMSRFDLFSTNISGSVGSDTLASGILIGLDDDGDGVSTSLLSERYNATLPTNSESLEITPDVIMFSNPNNVAYPNLRLKPVFKSLDTINSTSTYIAAFSADTLIKVPYPSTGGTITGVTAGTDLTGGGTSGTVTLNSDTTYGKTKLATQGYVQRNDTLTNTQFSTVTATTDFLTIDTSTGKVNRFPLPPCPITVDSVAYGGTGDSINVTTSAGYNYKVFTGSGASTGVTNVGSGYGTNFTAITSTGNVVVDSTVMMPKIDSGTLYITPTKLTSKGYITTAVTSVATGYGLSGGTITTTGTLTADTTKLLPKSDSGYLFITPTGLSNNGFLKASNNLSDVSNTTTALNNILPSQTGNSGKVIGTNGTTASWVAGGGGTSDSITEQKTYYRGEYIAYDSIVTSTGAIVAGSSNNAISGYIHCFGSESVTINVPVNYPNVTIYGWTYDTTLTAISEIRSHTLIGTSLNSYTFTTPSNARFMVVYIKYGGYDFSASLNVKSTNTITYSIPIVPENYSGSKSTPIQSALNFARFTSSPVILNGSYTVDSTLLMSSGNTLILNNATLTLDSGSKTNIIRNAAIMGRANFFTNGNTQINIIGIGNAYIKGSKAAWGAYPPTGVGAEYWRAYAVYLANVENFNIKGITFLNTNMWAVSLEQSRVGLVSDITILQDSAHFNQDGIDIRSSSDRITIQNIKGRAMDDLVALTNLLYGHDTLQVLGVTTPYEPYKTNLDISNIIIKNIQRDSSKTFAAAAVTPFYQNGVGLYVGDSMRIHDVDIDGVSQNQQIQIGYPGYSLTTIPTIYNIYDINVSNVFGSGVNVYYPIQNSSFINISETSNGLTNVSLPTGCRRIYRKYYDYTSEYIDSSYSSQPITEVRGKSVVSTNERFTNSNGDGVWLTNDNTSSYVEGLTNGLNVRNLTLQGKNIYFNTGTSTYSGALSVDSTGNTNALSSVASAAVSITANNTKSSSNIAIKSYGSAFSISNLANISALIATADMALIPNAAAASGGNYGIAFYSGGYSTQRMRLFSNGTLGINTTTDSTTGKLIVTGNLSLNTAGNKLLIKEGTNGSVGQTTLTSGVSTISISGLTTSSRAILSFVSMGGTTTTTWQYAGVCTSGTLTITALVNGGGTNTLDTSTLNYEVIN